MYVVTAEPAVGMPTAGKQGNFTQYPDKCNVETAENTTKTRLNNKHEYIDSQQAIKNANIWVKILFKISNYSQVFLMNLQFQYPIELNCFLLHTYVSYD